MAEKILKERDDGVRLIRVQTPDDVLPYRASFAGAYQTIFSEPPYNERFFPSEAQAVLQSYLEIPGNISVLAVRGRASVVGFGITVPARSKADITRELRGLIPLQHAHYFAEMGVLSKYRGAGLGNDLVEVRLAVIDRQRFTHVVLRTSAVRNASYQMYMRRGFDDMGVYMEVPSRRVDGRVATDRRLFLHKVLSPDEGESCLDEEVADPETWQPDGGGFGAGD
jgi:GNAT superfamily N-acetyltransferase